jgi:hypothetical protein
MDRIRQSIRFLQNKLVPGIPFQEENEIRTEIDILETEYKKIESIQKQLLSGISFYGSYFSS